MLSSKWPTQVEPAYTSKRKYHRLLEADGGKVLAVQVSGKLIK